MTLTNETRTANQGSFPAGQTVPRQAITMGIGTILRARRIVLLATGRAKAEAVAHAWSGPRTPDCPASALQGHPAVSFVCDRAAASAIKSGQGSAGR